MKNTNALKTKEFEEIKIDASNVDDVEERIIKEHIGQIKIEGIGAEKEKTMIKELMHTLSTERGDQKVADFEKRIKEEVENILELN
jgi:hypothetical protein